MRLRLPSRALLLAAALAATPALALDPARAITQYGLDVWQAEQGLPNNTVRKIVRTRGSILTNGIFERSSSRRPMVSTRDTVP